MNSTLDFTYIPILMKSSSAVSLILFLVISYLTLPFYVYVHILRRQREKNLPVVQLFYKIVKLSYFVLIIVISMMAFIAWIREILEPELSLTEILMGLLMISLFIIIYPLHILQQTFHLLLFLLATLNYLKYFFPYDFLYSHNYIRIYVKVLNVLFVSKDFLTITISFRHGTKFFNDHVWRITSSCYLSLFIFVNIAVCLIIPLIYIPIIIDMKKNSHRYSQQHLYLLKYLFVQGLLVSLMKMITLPFCSTIFDFTSPLSFMFSMTIGDAVTTPLIIQLSYLNCNLRELFSLYVSFNLWSFLKVLSGKVDNSVNPNLPPHAFSIT